jgi:hypothetical protein
VNLDFSIFSLSYIIIIHYYFRFVKGFRIVAKKLSRTFWNFCKLNDVVEVLWIPHSFRRPDNTIFSCLGTAFALLYMVFEAHEPLWDSTDVFL